MTRADARYDAVVVGGGPAGASAAILLARAGWTVAVIERTTFPRRKVCGEFVSAPSWPLLRALGVSESLLAAAGPPVRRVGLYAADVVVDAAMPAARDDGDGWGRALGREHLDTVLLARAAQCGARILQPCTLAAIERVGGGYVCTSVTRSRAASHRVQRCRTPMVIAAHGSWEPGPLPTQVCRRVHRSGDLIAFKAHFRGAQLERHTMPLLLFPGGYGGMVETDAGRVSLSCCIRRDMLERCRRRYPGSAESARAGDAVLAHILASCEGARGALAGAVRSGAWLSAGPIRPGMRRFRQPGLFALGNALGEAHPIVAEGISMAIQSAWLLCALLVPNAAAIRGARAAGSLAALQRAYERDWRRNFAPRIHAAALFAGLAAHEPTRAVTVASVRHAPALLTLGARWGGKAQPLRTPRDALIHAAAG